jgi:hypothetical protein
MKEFSNRWSSVIFGCIVIFTAVFVYFYRKLLYAGGWYPIPCLIGIIAYISFC